MEKEKLFASVPVIKAKTEGTRIILEVPTREEANRAEDVRIEQLREEIERR